MSTRQIATQKAEPSLLTQLRKAVFGSFREHVLSHLGSARNPMAFRCRRQIILIMFASVLLGVNSSEAGLKIYYIRHAEGGHNVKKNWETYSDIPQDQWPAYVGDPDVFTPMGKGQLDRVAGKLKRYRFDFIAASPMWRARNTILSYMKEVGATGEIWPELHEVYAPSQILSPDLTPPAVKILGEGDPVELPSDETHYFSLREDGLNKFKLPPFKPGHVDIEAEAAAAQVIMQRVVDMIQNRFGGSGKTILLSGHGSSGKGILRMLTKNKLSGFPSITNTGIWMVEEQPNGEFMLMMYNDVPLAPLNAH